MLLKYASIHTAGVLILVRAHRLRREQASFKDSDAPGHRTGTCKEVELDIS